MEKRVIGNCELYLGDCMDIMPMIEIVNHVINVEKILKSMINFLIKVI